MTTRLTKRRLLAMQEALIFRLAGEIEEGEGWPPPEDYDKALDWVSERLAKIGGDTTPPSEPTEK